MLLTLDHISKTYTGNGRSVDAVKNVSLTVDAGEFVAVAGPSGCGKTTLLLIAGGLLGPDAGDVRVDDRNPYTLSVEERAVLRATRIGFVFQQFHLVPYLSVLDNVLSPALVTAPADARDRALQLIADFGLTDRRDHRPGQLSTGERQRTALARAMLNRPALILADEPTGNLDAENSTDVLEALSAFAADGGGVLLVTHDPEAIRFASRTIQIKDGSLVSESEQSSEVI